ncbi:MAG TPA: DUF1269 domain-containing protein [Gemmatimonadales bacterium]|nr:DUF1269 domain-containing protein [Gemmatimonadales bacterium]
MRDLIAVGFAGKHRAAEVLGQLEELNWQGKVDLHDAVAIYRTESGKLRVDESVQPTPRQGAAYGGLLGAMLGGILAAPFTAGVSAATAAAAMGVGAASVGSVGAVIGATDADDWKAAYGVPEDYVKQVGGMVQPGTSAVLALVSVNDPYGVADRFRGYGGTVLKTTLSPREAAKVQQTFKPKIGV